MLKVRDIEVRLPRSGRTPGGERARASLGAAALCALLAGLLAFFGACGTAIGMTPARAGDASRLHAVPDATVGPFSVQRDLPFGEAGAGTTMALSADGNTALLGDPDYGANCEPATAPCVGAVEVWTRTNGIWSEQALIVPGDESPGEAQFGWSVALSGDGNTAIVGGPDTEDYGAGAAWVFMRSNGTWTEQAKIEPDDETNDDGQFGTSVALSADGSTALIGGPDAAWVYAGSGADWAEEAKIVPSDEASPGDAAFGSSVALSSNGDTALIGGPGEGAAWVYTGAGPIWTEQQKLVPDSDTTGGAFGSSVALSADGGTALVGSPTPGVVGEALVYTQSGGSWTEQTSITPTDVVLPPTGVQDPAPGFGTSVALSSDGDAALIGNPTDGDTVRPNVGAVWLYGDSGGDWSERQKILDPMPQAPEFGSAVALSGDASTALIDGWVYTTGVANCSAANDLSSVSSMSGTACPTVPISIVQLGDSIGSGEGTLYGYQYVEGKTNSDGTWVDRNPNKNTEPAWTGKYSPCHDSPFAYGKIVSYALGAGDAFDQRACTGASYDNGITKPETEYPGGSGEEYRPAEFPPSDTQLFSQPATQQVVLVTFGADDVQFSNIVASCVVNSPRNTGRAGSVAHTACLACPDEDVSKVAEDHGRCEDRSPPNGRRQTAPPTYAGGDTFQEDFTDELPKLFGPVPGTNPGASYYDLLVAHIHMLDPHAEIVFTDYADPFPRNDEPCADTGGALGLTKAQISFLRHGLDTLDGDIRLTVDALHDPYVGFVDIERALDDHTWCTADPWAYGLSLYTLHGVGQSILYHLSRKLFGEGLTPAPFHPTPEGQQKIANLVVARVKTLLGDSTPTPTATPIPPSTLTGNGVVVKAAGAVHGQVSGFPPDTTVNIALGAPAGASAPAVNVGADGTATFSFTFRSAPSGPNQLFLTDLATGHSAILPVFVPYR